MPAKRTPEEQAAYMRGYRKRKNEISSPEVVADSGTPVPDTVPDVPLVPDVARSNYYSDHAAPGGWSETIRNIDPALAVRILDHPAIRTKR